MRKESIKKIITAIVVLLAGILAGTGVTLSVMPNNEGGITTVIETGTKIELSETTVPAVVETENGEEIFEIPTVETVDGGEVKDEDAQGAWHDTSSYVSYYNSVGLGNCINNAYGAQCFALANDFWSNYSGRALSSCGTGAAKGTINCYEYNAGNEFVMIWDATQIQPGDWLVFSGGEWGHIGMALGYYNNGYVSLFGQNQGGGYCYGGGAATNVINKSTKDFIGAFRPKSYIVEEPKVEPQPTEQNTFKYSYTYGKDYFSKVLVQLGLDEGNLWGDSGTVKYYTQQLIEQDMLDSNGNVKLDTEFTLQRR